MRTISHELVTTRKPHRCWGCIEMFKAGTQMYRSVWRDGGIHVCHTCKPCQEYFEEACRQDRYLADDGVEEGWVKDRKAEEAAWSARMEQGKVQA